MCSGKGNGWSYRDKDSSRGNGPDGNNVPDILKGSGKRRRCMGDVESHMDTRSQPEIRDQTKITWAYRSVLAQRRVQT